jgi:aminoglycoside 6'-N-acetyltransferase I
MNVLLQPCVSADQPGWLDLRAALWPDCSREELLTEMASLIVHPERFAQFIAYSASGQALGFVEASIRTDYVNGTTTSPVAFIEGLYVVPEARKKHVGKRLVDAVVPWALAAGCTELASDALLENQLSHRVHEALGFTQTERVVFFLRKL